MPKSKANCHVAINQYKALQSKEYATKRNQRVGLLACDFNVFTGWTTTGLGYDIGLSYMVVIHQVSAVGSAAQVHPASYSTGTEEHFAGIEVARA